MPIGLPTSQGLSPAQRVEAPTAPTPALPLRPNTPWMHFHAPDGWFYSEEDGWLPELSALQIKPGTNGISEANGVVNAGPAVGVLVQKGYVVIPNEHPVVGDYLRRRECATKRVRGWYHHTRWEEPRLLAGRVMWRRDEKARREWLKDLVTRGIVPPMEPEVLELKIAVQAKRVNRFKKRAVTDLHAKERMEIEQRQLSAMEGAWRRQFAGEAEPTKGQKRETA